MVSGSPRFGRLKLFRQVSPRFRSKLFFPIQNVPLEVFCHRPRIQIFQPWLKLRRTVHTVLSSSWGFLEISLFVLEQHGPMGRLGVVFLMHYQFTVVSFVNQIRCSVQFSLYFNQVEVHCTILERAIIRKMGSNKFDRSRQFLSFLKTAPMRSAVL